jgi:methionyl-tRNA formyltransferase
MRLAFLGTPAPAVPSLRALVEAGHEIDVVITRPDKRRGRGSELMGSPVKAAALELGLPVEHGLSALRERDVDLAVVVAYGRIIPVDLLDRFPMVNVHFSLLPRWRGAAPVERALLAGDEHTGVCIMALEETLDTGGIYASATTPIANKTTSQLLDELATVGANLLVETLASGLPLPEPRAQSGEVTYAEKMEKSDFFLSPERSGEAFSRIVRTERASAQWGDKRCKVLATGRRRPTALPAGTARVHEGALWWATSDEEVEIVTLQVEGSTAMSAESFLAGRRGIVPGAWATPSIAS